MTATTNLGTIMSEEPNLPAPWPISFDEQYGSGASATMMTGALFLSRKSSAGSTNTMSGAGLRPT
jgi:hypothetical protein